ncbi:hypothetical protein G7K_6119-t1 [Saitoella complicata NRRL Y-17804]|uniref:Ferrochelatase n=1 Tax=Saitoella complicata (strain BCRC 22490 / CBS 7301 / JCM 7358 / NBRC 10748 / NRRL Y-17804) TaxID=698492 RepID=A0A0E9NQT6_SAICN|nr:hypothetical protein G7K_6119-t1 [Saitoella complicata NRRL Y-17804]
MNLLFVVRRRLRLQKPTPNPPPPIDPLITMLKLSIRSISCRQINPAFFTARHYASATPEHQSGKTNGAGTAVVMMNMGGPSTIPEVYDFLRRLFSDGDLIPLGRLQKWMGPVIARRRTPSIEKAYESIGGGSPIRKWSELQGREMCKILDEISPATGPHKPYVAFRYAAPLTEDTLAQMKTDGITRAVAFTQYPQWSCSTTGSSLNELHRQLKKFDPENTIEWSVLDRWPTDTGLVKTFAQHIRDSLATYPEADRKDVVILFSAHSLPMSVINRGDPYPHEVAATVNAVMKELNFSNPYRLVWQSQVGPSAWLGPQTQDAIQGYVAKSQPNLLLVPIAFTSDHIETLHELEEYIEEAHAKGAKGVKRVESLNGDMGFIKGMANLMKKHLEEGGSGSRQMSLRCPGCVNAKCEARNEWVSKQMGGKVASLV